MQMIDLRRLAFVAIAAATLLAGCVSPGGLNGMSKDPMRRITYTCSDGQCSPDQIVLVAIAANITNEQLIPQFSGKLESAATGCAVYGTAYAVAGATQPVFYTGALAGAAAGLGAVTGCLGGAGNGLYTYSYAIDASTGSATESALRDWEHGKKIPAPLKKLYPNIQSLAEGLHVQASYIRTNNSTPKNLPNFHGPADGSPVQ